MAAPLGPLMVEPGLYDLNNSYYKFMRFVGEACRRQSVDENIVVYVVTPYIDVGHLEDLIAWARGYNPEITPSEFLRQKRDVRVQLYTRTEKFPTLEPELAEHHGMDVHLVPLNHSPDFHCKWAAMRDGENVVVLHTSANVHSKNMSRTEGFHQREFFETIAMTADEFEERFFNPIESCCQERDEGDELAAEFNNLNVADELPGEYFGLYDETICFTQFQGFVQEGYATEGTTVYIAMAPAIDPATAGAVLRAGGAKSTNKIFYKIQKMTEPNFLNIDGWGIETRPNFHCKWAAFSYFKDKIKVVDILLTSAVMVGSHMSAERNGDRGARSFINSLHRINEMRFDMFRDNFLNMIMMA